MLDKKTLRKIRLVWTGGVAIGLTVFFAIDIYLYFFKGEDYTLSDTLRSVLAVDKPADFFKILGAFLFGVWFSHFFQFGSRSDG